MRVRRLHDVRYPWRNSSFVAFSKGKERKGERKGRQGWYNRLDHLSSLWQLPWFPWMVMVTKWRPWQGLNWLDVGIISAPASLVRASVLLMLSLRLLSLLIASFSVSALLMMVTLKKLASTGCTLVFTINQSSTEVFGLFDRICLLSNGNTLFFGETLACLQVILMCIVWVFRYKIYLSCMVPLKHFVGNHSFQISILVSVANISLFLMKHFANAGFPCPIMQSPSDHFLRAINTDFDRIIAMCKNWQVTHSSLVFVYSNVFF